MGSAISSVKAEIEKVTERLIKRREKISAERIPMVKESRALEAEVVKLRGCAGGLRALKSQREHSYDVIKEEAEFLRGEIEFVSSLLLEYRRETETHINPAEAASLSKRLSEIDAHLTAEKNIDVLRAVEPLLSLARMRAAVRLGGDVFKGSAFDRKGVRRDGRFVLAGPVAYFCADNGELAGIVVSKLGSTEPSVEADGIVSGDAIRKLAEGAEVSVPIDFTGGDAFRVRFSREGWLAHIKKGGAVMFPILAIGLLCIALSIWKFISLRHLRVDVKGELERIVGLLRSGEIERANKLARSLGLPLGPVILEGVAHRGAPRENIEEIMHERVLSEIPVLERHLSTLAVCASASPLLGLLGTVTGIIHTFGIITIFGTGDPKLLSSGISEALITTEYGLMIAIPVLIIHAYFARRVRKIIGVMEQAAIGFVNGIKIRAGSGSSL